MKKGITDLNKVKLNYGINSGMQQKEKRIKDKQI